MIHLEQMNRIHSVQEEMRKKMQKSQARDNRALNTMALKKIKENKKRNSTKINNVGHRLV